MQQVREKLQSRTTDVHHEWDLGGNFNYLDVNILSMADAGVTNPAKAKAKLWVSVYSCICSQNYFFPLISYLLVDRPNGGVFGPGERLTRAAGDSSDTHIG